MLLSPLLCSAMMLLCNCSSSAVPMTVQKHRGPTTCGCQNMRARSTRAVVPPLSSCRETPFPSAAQLTCTPAAAGDQAVLAASRPRPARLSAISPTLKCLTMDNAYITPASIQAIAHSIDIPKLSDDAARALSPDVDYRLREIIQARLHDACLIIATDSGMKTGAMRAWRLTIVACGVGPHPGLHGTQDAKKFAHHARRTKLTIEDINAALRERNVEVRTVFARRVLHAHGVLHAHVIAMLTTAHCMRPQPLYGLGDKDPAKFVRATGHPDVCLLKDRELSFEQVMGSRVGLARQSHAVNSRDRRIGVGGLHSSYMRMHDGY
eukprot:363897-Chlamydomonas_euryale.AAC.13